MQHEYEDDELPLDFNNLMDAGSDSAMELAADEAERVAFALASRPVSVIPPEVYEIEELRARALAIRDSGEWRFPHTIVKGSGDNAVASTDAKSDQNFMYFFDILFDNGSGLCKYPFFDLFRGTLVTHHGDQLNEFTVPSQEIANALEVSGLRNPNFNKIDEMYRRWAANKKENSMTVRMARKTPIWDGMPRLEDYLIRLFRLRDTPTNRIVCVYFWMSLYNRLTHAGCNAPISIAFIGAQDLGKSYFSVLTCQILMDNPTAISIPIGLHDIEKGQIQWFRRMTGNSIIANIGELKGFRQADINTMKDFATRATDNFDHKFASAIDVPRQWVMILDGNSYEGFQRDETGNRRFYPLFVNQMEDDDEGHPRWVGMKGTGTENDEWKVDFTTYRHDLWQIMAECKAIIDGNINKHAYIHYCSTDREKSMLIFGVKKEEQLEYEKSMLILYSAEEKACLFSSDERKSMLISIYGEKKACLFTEEEEKSMLIKAIEEKACLFTPEQEISMLIALYNKKKACLFGTEEEKHAYFNKLAEKSMLISPEMQEKACLFNKKHAYFNGQEVYSRIVGAASKEVSQFSDKELAKGSGAIRDDSTDAAMRAIILSASFCIVDKSKHKGCFLTNTEIQNQWNKRMKGSINFKAVSRFMTNPKLGFEPIILAGLGRGFLFRDTDDVAYVKKVFWMGGIEEAKKASERDNSEFNNMLANSLQPNDTF